MRQQDIKTQGAVLGIVKDYARSQFENAMVSHDWEHTLRVSRLCEKISQTTPTDIEVLLISAFLHDIGRCVEDKSNGKCCHALIGANMAEKLLVDLPLTAQQKDNIVHCIESHRFRGDRIPRTIEARVLFDADKLDAIGAVGIARAYLFAGEIGARLHNENNNIKDTLPYTTEDTGYREFMVKLCKIKDRMLTEEGKRLAEDRHAFMLDFFQRFLEEHSGNR